MNQKNDLEKAIVKCQTRPIFRQNFVYQSHALFFKLYLAEYIKYPLAWFHEEMLEISEKENLKLAVIMAFRGSGKSTILNTSFALWAILGKLEKKYIIIISQSRDQARAHFENIKNELENNKLLRGDLGPFKLSADDWGGNFIEIKRFQAKIMFISSTQEIRGLRHGPHRPDLIICDDIEDSLLNPKLRKRKKLIEWFKSEVLPAGSENTTVIVLGNLLDKKSLLIQLKKEIDKGLIDGVFRAYPLLDDNGRITWPEKFKSWDDILKFKKMISSDKIWEREYLLKVGTESVILLPEKVADKDGVNSKKTALNDYGYLISAPIIHNGVIFYESDSRFDQINDNDYLEKLREAIK